MPIRITVPIHFDGGSAGVEGQHLQANVCRWLGQTEEEHRAPVQPFSISLLGSYGHDPQRQVFELGVIDDAFAMRALRGLDREAGSTLRLGPAEARLAWASPGTRWERTWVDLVRSSRAGSGWRVHCLTPMLFRNRNEDLVLPHPGSMVISLARRWERFAPFAPDGSEWTGRRRIDGLPRMEIADLCGETAAVRIRSRDGRGDRVGFVGAVDLVPNSSASDGQLAAMDALLCLAEFAGLGSMTTAGLGVAAVERH